VCVAFSWKVQTASNEICPTEPEFWPYKYLETQAAIGCWFLGNLDFVVFPECRDLLLKRWTRPARALRSGNDKWINVGSRDRLAGAGCDQKTSDYGCRFHFMPNA
jgi:hypothetical protein